MEHQTDSAHEQTPHKHSTKRQILISVAVLILLVSVTTLAILYGKGYRLGFPKGEPKVSKTGILHVTSLPTGGQVYIDGHLTTAANNTINLTPGKYNVKITKDGYSDWQKDIEIQKEVVINAEAVLFPKAPTLQSISTLGIESLLVDPSKTKLAFKIASQSAKRNGIYVLDMTSRTFPVLAGQSGSTQVVDDTTDVFSEAHISWSPDGKQLLASISGELDTTTYYLLKADSFNETPQDVTATVTSITDLWTTQRKDKEEALVKSLKSNVQKYANKNFRILSWSPDETKVLYQASESGQMDVFLKPRRIGNNVLYERRDLEKGAIYVYDATEDINTRIIEPTEERFCTIDVADCIIPFTWLPDSSHLVYVHDKKIAIVEDDGSNMTTIYAGPFINHYAYPWSDGSKLVILTNLNNLAVSPTLYTVGLK